MNIIVGERSALAIECVESKGDPSLGRIFLYVNGVKFGEESFDFEIDAMIRNTIKSFALPDIDFNGLFDCPEKELFESLEMIDDFEMGVIDKIDMCPAEKYMPNFVENILEIDRCVFRYVHYAFDKCMIVTIPSNGLLKLNVKDFDRNILESTVTSVDDFLGLWKKIAADRSAGKSNETRSPDQGKISEA